MSIINRNKPSSDNPRYMRIKAGELVIDHKVQRPISQAHVNRIVSAFDWRKLGTLLVSNRKNGEMVVLNGQHRLQALRELGYGDAEIKCEVYDGLTVAEEADLFTGHNAIRNPSAFDRFEKSVLAEDPRYVAMHDTLTRHGLRVVRGGTYEGRGVRAVGAVERVYDMREGLLDLVCGISTQAWPMNADATDANVFIGLGIFLDTYWDEVDTDALLKKLAKYPGGPAVLIANAAGLKGLMGSTGKAVAELIREHYNKGRSAKHKLGAS